MNKSSPFVLWTYGITLTMLIVLSIAIGKGDDVLFINGHHSALLDRVFVIITRLGNGVIIVPLIVCLMFVQYRLVVLACVIGISNGIVCSVLKKQFFYHLERPRSLIDNDLLHFVPNVDVPGMESFPSGHTATIFCVAFLSSLVLRNRNASGSKMLSVTLLLVALTVAYSRIYLLQHFLMDVAAGAAIGIAVAWIWWTFFKLDYLPQWMYNHLSIKMLRPKQNPG